jgi:CBS domain-containing protein
MLIRLRDLEDQMVATDEQVVTLPVEAARSKAREIIAQSPHDRLISVIQKWRQLPDGQIEFAIRHFPVTDEVPYRKSR